MKKRNLNDYKEILDTMSAPEALLILKMLSQEDPMIKKRIKEISLNQVHEVDISEISDGVFSDLNFLDV